MNIRQQLTLETMDALVKDGCIASLGEHAKEILRQALRIDEVRNKVVTRRLERALKNNELHTLNHDPDLMRTMRTGKTTIDHNMDGVFNDTSSARSARLIKPLSCIEEIRPLAINQRPRAVLQDIDIELDQKVLCIGPRTESEPLLLWAYGWRLESIEAIDLISYSPLIKLGDMHNLPFEDNSFDIAICSCTLVYSNNILRAVHEIQRVLKPSGIHAIMLDIPGPEYEQESISLFGRRLFDPESICELFFPQGNYKMLHRQFAIENLGLPNGASSIAIFRAA